MAFLLLLVLCSLFAPGWALSQVFCDGHKLSEELESRKNCTVIEGNVLVGSAFHDSGGPDHFSSVRQITGYLLVYQAKGLESIGDVFPNLRLIGGEELILDTYALVVFQNPDLRHLGLHRLVEISVGGVRIDENAFLCNADSVYWPAICKQKHPRIHISRNQSPNECNDRCRSAEKAEAAGCLRRPDGRIACWNESVCQAECGSQCDSGCDGNGQCCSAECLAGCSGPGPSDCYICRSVFHGNSCADACPPGLFTLGGRRCLSEEECHDLSNDSEHYYKAVEGMCSPTCPEGYELNATDPMQCSKCHGRCLKSWFHRIQVQECNDHI